MNVALFGVGKFGKNYARLLQEIPGVSFRAVVTKDEKSLENVSLPRNTIHSTNPESIMKDAQVEAVIIATPPSTHFELIKLALENGKHVLVEKPMVLSIQEAEALKPLAEKSEKILMVGYQYLYNDNINYLKKEIESGTFGKILEISSEHFLSPARLDVDVFWDAAPHPLAIFQYFFQPTQILNISGERKNVVGGAQDDTVFTTVKFDQGPVLNIKTSWLGKEKIRKLTIVGELATAVLDETKEQEKLMINFKNGEMKIPHLEVREPLKTELETFIGNIERGASPLTDFQLGYRVTEFLEKIATAVRRSS